MLNSKFHFNLLGLFPILSPIPPLLSKHHARSRSPCLLTLVICLTHPYDLRDVEKLSAAHLRTLLLSWHWNLLWKWNGKQKSQTYSIVQIASDSRQKCGCWVWIPELSLTSCVRSPRFSFILWNGDSDTLGLTGFVVGSMGDNDAKGLQVCLIYNKHTINTAFIITGSHSSGQ